VITYAHQKLQNTAVNQEKISKAWRDPLFLEWEKRINSSLSHNHLKTLQKMGDRIWNLGMMIIFLRSIVI